MRLTCFRYLSVIILISSVSLIGAIVPAFASGGEHGEAGELKHVVTLEDKSGISLFMARIYNDNRLLYALVVTATMAVLGIVVAQVTEFILKLIGVR